MDLSLLHFLLLSNKRGRITLYTYILLMTVRPYYVKHYFALIKEYILPLYYKAL